MPADIEVKLDQWAFSGLRLASGPHALTVGRIALRGMAAQLGIHDGKPQLHAVQAAEAELADVKVEGPLGVPAGAGGLTHTAQGTWSLAPLATADGALNAEITDAHLLFDAQVRVPIARGVVDFNRATVEHVGPDSRMGVSRMGIYVDAPNGRSYLYQFPSAPVAGVAYERRGPLPGPWASDRGSLQLQPFMEALLRQGPGAAGSAVTEQARLLLDRTAVMGELHLADGAFSAPGVRGALAGRAAGRNRARLHSEAVGRGITLDMEALSIVQGVLSLGAMRAECDEIAGSLTLRLYTQGAQLRFALGSAGMKLTRLRFEAPR